MNEEEEFFDAVTGFDSDDSTGEFSEANKISGMIDLDTSKKVPGVGKMGRDHHKRMEFKSTGMLSYIVSRITPICPIRYSLRSHELS